MEPRTFTHPQFNVQSHGQSSWTCFGCFFASACVSSQNNNARCLSSQFFFLPKHFPLSCLFIYSFIRLSDTSVFFCQKVAEFFRPGAIAASSIAPIEGPNVQKSSHFQKFQSFFERTGFKIVLQLP